MASTVKASSSGAKTQEESWRTSSLYPELMVSSYGRVKERSYQKVVPDGDGTFRIYDVASKMLHPSLDKVSGDLSVSFTSGGKWTSEKVDFLVATEFVTNEDPSIYQRVSHLDGNKINVNASNLVWNGYGIHAKDLSTKRN